MATYIPNTPKEQLEMLNAIGKSSIDELFCKISKELRFERELDIPCGRSEFEVVREMKRIAQKNVVFDSIFRGAGAYKHFVPSVVRHMMTREEFVSSYTPYQAEVSQGVLQAIFEFQTMVCRLTGMDVANASVYDGATAAVEAINMCADQKRRTALVAQSANPQTKAVVETFCRAANIDVKYIPHSRGAVDTEVLSKMMRENVACVYIEQPNFFGIVEDAELIGNMAHEKSAKFIIGCNPIALAVLKSPAEFGADIAVGEGQQLGLPLSFGGPYLGFMACKAEMTRKLPGRIVGETVDNKGSRAFVLTLQAREQHIRREKASSSICTNQALCALGASIYLAAMGPRGLYDVAQQCMEKARYAYKNITALTGFESVFAAPFFNEFVTKSPICATELMQKLEQHGILGGYPLDGELDGHILWCVTEVNTKQEIDKLVSVLAEVRA